MEHALSFNTRFLALSTPADLAAEIRTIETYEQAVPRILAKASHRLLHVEQLPAACAMILKQELLAIDADALISPDVYLGSSHADSDALIFATLRQLGELIPRLRRLPLPPLQALAHELEQLIGAEAPLGSLILAGQTLRWGARTYIMGIINMTPDSFSADGLLQAEASSAPLDEQQLAEAALERAKRCAAEGADILDIGGESTRPGAQLISSDEELRRVVPAIAAISGAINMPISIDTYHAAVAEAALDAGAHLINDVWGLRSPDGSWNAPLARLVAEREVPIVLMHNRHAPLATGDFGGHYREISYRDLMGEIIGELRACVAYAEAQGIRRERIIIDPGLGFGKRPEHNLEVLRRLGELRSLGMPLLVGASRKSFIGRALGLPPHERDEGTAATTTLAIQAGADIVRVHNVQMNIRAARVADTIVRGSQTDS